MNKIQLKESFLRIKLNDVLRSNMYKVVVNKFLVENVITRKRTVTSVLLEEEYSNLIFAETNSNTV